MTDKDGRFKLTTYKNDDGAIVGKHTVTVGLNAEEGSNVDPSKAFACKNSTMEVTVDRKTKEYKIDFWFFFLFPSETIMSKQLSVRRKARFGFTLVELLVVIAIIGILVGLLLPAVQAAREAARRMQCSNNVKQLSLSLHNYESANKAFPAGSIVPRLSATYPPPAPGSNQAKTAGWAWTTAILPYIEQTALHDATAGRFVLMGQAVADPVAQVLLRQRLGTFRCPSDAGPDTNDAPAEHHFRFGLEVAGNPWFIDGSTAGPRVALSLSNYVAMHSHQAHGYVNNALAYTGAFGPNRPVKIGTLSDGTSNTICVGERGYRVQGVMMHAATWTGCAAAAHDDCIDDVMATARSPINPTQTAIYNTYARQQALSSNHTGGVQVGLFDGSVRFLSQNVDFVMAGGSNTSVADSVYEYLIHISDGTPVGDF
jgi:prepilin-type N-terminal cleavage/methylation domain-containing protein